jgi:uncharacterized protein (TIGR02147 family)
MEKVIQSIYSYLDYRKFLSDFYQAAKKSEKGYSYRVFSQKAGIVAPNFLQWLIEGKRNLAVKTIPGVVCALGLDEKQAEYFSELVQFGQSKDIKAKTAHFQRMTEQRKPFDVKLIEESQYAHYGEWYNEAIRISLKLSSFDPGEKWAYRKLGKRLSPAITESQAKNAIRLLLELGLAHSDNEGIIHQTDAILSTGDEVSSFLARKFQERMIDLAQDSMDRFPREQRDVSCISLTASDECFSMIKKEVQLMRKRILEMVSLDKKPSNVYQLNFQFFPLTPVDKNGTEHNNHD